MNQATDNTTAALPAPRVEYAYGQAWPAAGCSIVCPDGARIDVEYCKQPRQLKTTAADLLDVTAEELQRLVGIARDGHYYTIEFVSPRDVWDLPGIDYVECASFLVDALDRRHSSPRLVRIDDDMSAALIRLHKIGRQIVKDIAERDESDANMSPEDIECYAAIGLGPKAPPL